MASFDDTKQASLKAALLAQFPAASDVLITVEPASIRVNATLVLSSSSDADAAVQKLQMTPVADMQGTWFASVGVTLEGPPTVGAVYTEGAEGPAADGMAQTAGAGEGTQDTEWVIGAVTGGVVGGVVLLIAAAVAINRWCERLSYRKAIAKQTSMLPKPVAIQVVEPFDGIDEAGRGGVGAAGTSTGEREEWE